MEKTSEIIIIGAGISGLLAGKILDQAGRSVTILEKSRGIGGRMATRRLMGGIFDHGAQFFTVREAAFHNWVDQWLQAGVAREWARGFPTGDGQVPKKGHPRYRGAEGMTSIPKYIAQGLDIQLRSLVESILWDGETWRVNISAGRRFSAERLILTAPVPQSLKLLTKGNFTIPKMQLEELQVIQYHPCISALGLLEEPSTIPKPGGLQIETGPIRWIGDNAKKGISPGQPAITIHASAEFSREHFEESDESLAQTLFEAAKPWVSGPIIAWQIHKWRFSQPIEKFPRNYYQLAELPGLYFAGDGFGGSRVEGAAISGIAIAESLIG
jgi:predicted NAD/FAD-dependent oxidoreductase